MTRKKLHSLVKKGVKEVGRLATEPARQLHEKVLKPEGARMRTWGYWIGLAIFIALDVIPKLLVQPGFTGTILITLFAYEMSALVERDWRIRHKYREDGAVEMLVKGIFIALTFAVAFNLLSVLRPPQWWEVKPYSMTAYGLSLIMKAVVEEVAGQLKKRQKDA